MIAIKTPDNEEYVSHLLKIVDEVSDEELKERIEKYNLTKEN